jgi:hypothetical protein
MQGKRDLGFQFVYFFPMQSKLDLGLIEKGRMPENLTFWTSAVASASLRIPLPSTVPFINLRPGGDVIFNPLVERDDYPRSKFLISAGEKYFSLGRVNSWVFFGQLL